MRGPSQPWHALLPGGGGRALRSIDELRAAKGTHAFLTEGLPGPPDVVEAIRAFRYLLLFGIACVVEDKYPPLTRCWKDLESQYMHDPAFDDGVFVQSWILLDFPFGPGGETALHYFAAFLREAGGGERLGPFIENAGKSRLGLYQDKGRTKKAAKLRELFTDRDLSVLPSVDEYDKGEIYLTRMMTTPDRTFMFGNPKAFPRTHKKQLEEMVIDKMLSLEIVPDVVQMYETFMKLAGPYWMSCVTSDQNAPIHDPDHYLGYLDRSG